MNTTLGIAVVALLLGLLLSAGVLVLGALGVLVWARAERRRMRMPYAYISSDDDQSTMVPHPGYRVAPSAGREGRGGHGTPQPAARAARATPAPRSSRDQAPRRSDGPMSPAHDMRRHTPPPQRGRDLGLQSIDPLIEPSDPDLEHAGLLGYLDDEHTRGLDSARADLFAPNDLPLDWAETEDDDELATEIFSAHSAAGDLADLGLDDDSSSRFR